MTEVVTFNGHVSTKDRATGQPVRPCLISVSAPRELSATFVLADLDPVACLRKLNATRHGRIQIMECEEIKYLCKEHLGLDILISLPKPPPQRR